MRSACAISGREIARIDTEITEYKIPLFPPSLPSFPRFRNFDSEREREISTVVHRENGKTGRSKGDTMEQHPVYCSINLLGGMYREYDSLFFRIEISFLLERRAVNFYASSENVSAIKYWSSCARMDDYTTRHARILLCIRIRIDIGNLD